MIFIPSRNRSWTADLNHVPDVLRRESKTGILSLFQGGVIFSQRHRHQLQSSEKTQASHGHRPLYRRAVRDKVQRGSREGCDACGVLHAETWGVSVGLNI